MQWLVRRHVYKENRSQVGGGVVALCDWGQKGKILGYVKVGHKTVFFKRGWSPLGPAISITV